MAKMDLGTNNKLLPIFGLLVQLTHSKPPLDKLRTHWQLTALDSASGVFNADILAALSPPYPHLDLNFRPDQANIVSVTLSAASATPFPIFPPFSAMFDVATCPDQVPVNKQDTRLMGSIGTLINQPGWLGRED
ncbi:hypothetical protein CH63R_11077 [Colletotrichum higginsianum IMI 349063]|uniref:Uncharacterized protein n=1 Tax=Colletotrichum higginsianum (strain IMI 349063) TaxID=759273 RepID=A0A1B7XXA4_COLHI|nr:hypothetical protein CH63R_11077 [Colletotrichum higginsianum IMI 349063]OBR04374.1 hypothetical protein CH63R_11077 [Colletotrichum higginsianum IMI 349063]